MRAPYRSDDAPVLKFRNYEPKSESLQGLAIEKPSVPSIEEQVGVAEVVHNDASQEPLLNLAPKRPNWDLKREMEPKMKKLRAITDRAIVRLIAARVAEEQQREGGDEGSGERVDLAAAIDNQQRREATEEED